MSNCLLRYAVVLLLASPFVGLVHAAAVFDNGGPAVINPGGSAMSDLLQAEDFQVAALTNLTAIRFWSLQSVAADYLGSIFWQIRTDSGGSPSTILGSGTATPTRIAAGAIFGFSQFQNDFSIFVPDVSPGKYWLTLHNGALSSTAFKDFYWSWADLNATNTPTSRGREQSLNPLIPGFTPNDQEHAFTVLNDVPEPGAVVLVAAGLAFLTVRSKRRLMGFQYRAGLLAMLLTGALPGQQAPALVMPMVNHGVSESLFVLALQDPSATALPFAATEMVQKHGPLIGDIETTSSEAAISAPPSISVLQTSAPRALNAVASNSFEGPGQGMPGFSVSGVPPDPTIAVGPNHIIAWVNTQFAIFDKAGNKLLPGNGFVNGNSLFAGIGNSCQTTNRGDPILQYDRLADRWILSQFAFGVNSNGAIVGPYLQCVAISTTNNPLGSYLRYSATFSSTSPSGFNDYGKLSVWPDGYYFTFNVFGGSPAGNNTGAGLCAMDRTSMLAGSATAAMLCAPITFYAGGAAFLPADLDGSTLPTTLAQGNPMVRYSFGGISLRIVKIKPDFGANTLTFNDGFGGPPGSFVNIPVGPTTVACNGGAGDCIEQPGTTTLLDTLADRLMYRLEYRNRGGVDSLIVNQSIDPDGAGPRSSAIRWYEIRSPFANPPSLFQNATFDPGASGSRWMGSMAMDKLGNILLGYSVVNTATNLKPSIAVTGRLRSDLRNQMQSEQVIFTGTGSQTVSGSTPIDRWGDYTTMQVDPVDDCTFWYINQYLAANGVFNWRTRISSFKFNGCQ